MAVYQMAEEPNALDAKNADGAQFHVYTTNGHNNIIPFGRILFFKNNF